MPRTSNVFTSFLIQVRANGLRTNYFFVSYILFIAGFFFLKDVKTHINLFYALILAPYMLVLPWNITKLPLRSRIFQTILILVGYLMITLIWSDKGTARDYLGLGNNCITLLTFFALTCELTLSINGFQRFLITLICCIAALAPYLLLIDPHYVIPVFPGRFADLLVLRNSVQIGNVYGMAALLVYFSMMQREKLGRALLSVLLLAAILPVFILAQSRGPMVGLYITFLLGGLFSRDSRLLFALCCITILIAFLLISHDAFLQNLIISRSDSFRIEIFHITFSLIKKKMFFGYGLLKDSSLHLANGMLIKHPHNLYLATWLYGGLAGLLLLLISLICAFRQAIVVFIKEKDFTYVALLMYASICVFTGNDMVIDHPVPLFLFYWMPIALLAAHEVKKKGYYVPDKTGKAGNTAVVSPGRSEGLKDA
jgi:O-antigen ligase